jgi:hypothetical protein
MSMSRQIDLNHLAAMARGAHERASQALAAAQSIQTIDARSSQALATAQQLSADMGGLAKIVQSLKMDAVGGTGRRLLGAGHLADGPAFSWGPGIVNVEEIPGRRLPFDFITDIRIPANFTGTLQATLLVTQEGPFVCTSRMIAFQSFLEFRKKDPLGNVVRFQGRSFGRYRPTDSARDQLDGFSGTDHGVSIIPPPGSGIPLIASPSNQSPFRSMEFDARIVVENAGSSFPRSNQPVPSVFWSRGIAGDPFQLGALDVFERGEVLTFKVSPQHLNNQPGGNLTGFGAGGVYPFSESGWDAVEGINDTETAGVTQDPVQRLPEGLLTIGFHGYKIFQPAGPGPGAY